MAEITFTEETIPLIRLFQDLTRTTVVDCMDTADRLLFVVKAGGHAEASGKGGEHGQSLRKKVNKDIRVVEYSDDPKQFVANVFRNYDVKKVEIETREGEGVHATVTADPLEGARASAR